MSVEILIDAINSGLLLLQTDELLHKLSDKAWIMLV